MSSGRYMAYSPSPSAPHSPHLGGLLSASTAIVEQEKLVLVFGSDTDCFKIMQSVTVALDLYHQYSEAVRHLHEM
ncbi:unnamed protein product [Ilex paraguariensis]|uniref:Uncharacterized protein n=1 Tax=Ilex paraguariensis TaxID=185542 RepID=A0ABC8UIA6_9AQUA